MNVQLKTRERQELEDAFVNSYEEVGRHAFFTLLKFTIPVIVVIDILAIVQHDHVTMATWAVIAVMISWMFIIVQSISGFTTILRELAQEVAKYERYKDTTMSAREVISSINTPRKRAINTFVRLLTTK